MRLGLQVPRFNYANSHQLGSVFGHLAERAEKAGFYSLWVMDHFFQISVMGPPEEEMLEGWSTLAFAAGHTQTIKLGALVTGVTYRYPAILVKTATTLDVLSGGRTYFGVGAAWNEEEHIGLGIPYPSTSERFERLEEMLQIAHHMWSGDEKPFHGKHYQLERLLNSPQAIQRPHPPIMIGGAGERKTLRLIAQYGDACNLVSRLGDEELKRKLGVLRDHCERLGRPYEEIEKTCLESNVTLSADGQGNTLSPQAFLDRLNTLAEMGFDQVIVNLPTQAYTASFDLYAGQIIPAAEKIQVAGR